MQKTDTLYTAYVEVLKEELLPAMGCTEPIAIAYAAAAARRILNELPCEVCVTASGNIIKNVKSVFVPNTGGLRGIPAAAAAGMAAGDPALELEVLSSIGEGEQAAIRQYLADTPIAVKLADSPFIFDIAIRAWAEEDSALVRIVNYHTNIVRVERNGQVLKEVEAQAAAEEGLTDKSVLTVEGILEFAREAALADVEDAVGRQVRYNTAIAQEGLRGDWGANIGSTLLLSGGDVETEARAWAAAGSDARMNGCEMPVVICSGSGNQGITASVPVWRYGVQTGRDRETILRAVCLSDLITIHQKTGIGRLSAYCGAVSAGVGAGCGIAWLRGADYEGICHTITNAAAMISGCICDGAKASCASKIAMGVETGILGYNMYLRGNSFRPGDGIVGRDVEETIRNVGILASQGMKETDRVILKIMTE